ncbi:hypothetical protein DS830_07390 [Bombilactobacillus bombi]|uniref:hypothetical protein n=1 Tax=Bombilactobacillus bombi TaxID=1303590 RepID=UPI000E5870A4|nr:hypothetical protein [Bombilactobacillus bombi]AXX65313.1 hypothetical protein DS830_07390 [Bombilactobacillus bombi]
MSKYKQLQHSYQQQQLIDVVMRPTKDIYTGTICQLNSRYLLMRVYNDYGLLNGYVLIAIRAIAFVSDHGADLERIKQRIKIAQSKELFASQKLTVPPFSADHLLTTVLKYLIDQQLIVLIIGATNYQYQQAKIQALNKQQVKIATVDFFDFAYNNQPIAFMKNQFDAIEFGGQELNQATKFFLQPHKHQLPIMVKANLHLIPLLKSLKDTETLIMVYINTSNNNFYVGKIINITNQEMVLSLVDQDGYFGGYALIRLSEVSFVSTQTDYLRIIATYRTWHQQDQTFVQPVLDDKMQFDNQNLWQSVFQQATLQKLMLRVQFRQLNTDFLAYGLQAKEKSVKLAVFDDLQRQTTQIQEFKYDDFARITFGYLNSYFTKAELIN